MNTRTWRKIHRYLGLIIGIQLFLWTLSGLIFSWNSIEAVRGENLIRKTTQPDLSEFKVKDIEKVIHDHAAGERVAAVTLKSILNRPTYELMVTKNGTSTFLLIDAVSGQKVSPINTDFARQIALNDFAEDVEVRSVEKIDSVGPHSEYRGKELPAFRVVMDHPTDTAIYVSADRGVVTTRRNNQWRVFDFFWMLHTMDYQGRDNFNHWILKSVSVFGLTTVLSGFVLWFKTSRLWRKRSNKNQSK